MSINPINVFYSYSHADSSHKKNIEKFNTLLRNEGLISEWSDKEILPGKNINNEIEKALMGADLIIFLVSIDFIASPACKKEWDSANKISKEKNKSLVSIIVRDCPWLDFENMSESLVLPYDGKPIALWDSEDSAWMSVYSNIRKLVLEIIEIKSVIAN